MNFSFKLHNNGTKYDTENDQVWSIRCELGARISNFQKNNRNLVED